MNWHGDPLASWSKRQGQITCDLEYEYLRREGLHEKLFVFTGHPETEEARVTLKGTLRVGWQTFSEDLALLGYDLGFSDPGLGSVITFDADGRGILLTTQAKSAAEFVDPIRTWIARRKKTGRCMPTRCLSCSRNFHVFPADIAAVRERWCRDCEQELNTFQRAAKRFIVRHQVSVFCIGLISMFLVPVFGLRLFGLLDSWVGWIYFPLVLVEFFVLFKVAVRIKIRIDKRVLKRYQNLADAGDVVAMANLGIIYRRASDDANAASWFRKAAEAGDIGGMVNLAEMYEKGNGGLQTDANQAVYWYGRAADIGSRVAQLSLERLQTLN